MIRKTTPLVHGVKDLATQRSLRELERTVNSVVDHANTLLPRTGVAVDLAEIHAALVALGLITE